MKAFLGPLARSLVRRQNVLAGLSGLLIGCTLGCGLIVWSNRGAPVIVHDEHEIDSPVAYNGHIDLYINLDRVRDCPSETSRWLWTWVENNGDRIKLFYPLMSNNTTLTDIGQGQRLILSIPIPPGVWPGQWYYRAKTVEHCSLLPNFFRSQIQESSNIPIHIVAGKP